MHTLIHSKPSSFPHLVYEKDLKIAYMVADGVLIVALHFVEKSINDARQSDEARGNAAKGSSGSKNSNNSGGNSTVQKKEGKKQS